MPAPPHPRTPAGTPARPAINAVSGSAAAAAPLNANISFTKVYTAASYAIQLSDLNRGGQPIVDTLSVADSEAGPWTRTLAVPAKGAYRFQVRWGGGCRAGNFA